MRGKVLAGGAIAAVLTVGTLTNGEAIASAGSDDITGGSIQAPDREFESDDREKRELRSLAEITIPGAAEAAHEAHPGQVTKIEIEDEEGYVVYEVEVAGDEGVYHEMKVDAGNGDILESETEDDSQDDGFDDRDDEEDRSDDRDDDD
jgi:uncharacterized membrane protein YkoI